MNVWIRAEGFELPDPELYKRFAAVVYTDGSCSSMDGIGGWAWVRMSEHGAVMEQSSGSETNTTVGKMELLAVVQALHAHQLGPVVIFSDSQYVVNAVGHWAPKWRRNDWVKSDGLKVKHAMLVDLGNRLLEQSGSSLRWVKGHARTLGNLRADELAGQARFRALGELEPTVIDVPTGRYL